MADYRDFFDGYLATREDYMDRFDLLESIREEERGAQDNG